MMYFSTTITAIGEEVADLLDGGVLILYADGAPPALAEVSVQHRVNGEVPLQPPSLGARLSVGQLSTRISAVGGTAWDKVRDLGHVVINFNGAKTAERPGEICVDACDIALMSREVRSGNPIVIAD